MTSTPSLHSSRLLVAVNPNTSPDLQPKPLEERLHDLHEALKKIHAGLGRDIKKQQYLSCKQELDDKLVECPIVFFNERTTKAQIVSVVATYGFAVVPEV